MPHYISDLREELQEALHTNDGDWSFDVTKKLLKMDSFLKESARWNPFAYRELPLPSKSYFFKPSVY